MSGGKQQIQMAFPTYIPVEKSMKKRKGIALFERKYDAVMY